MTKLGASQRERTQKSRNEKSLIREILSKEDEECWDDGEFSVEILGLVVKQVTLWQYFQIFEIYFITLERNYLKYKIERNISNNFTAESLPQGPDWAELAMRLANILKFILIKKTMQLDCSKAFILLTSLSAQFLVELMR